MIRIAVALLVASLGCAGSTRGASQSAGSLASTTSAGSPGTSSGASSGGQGSGSGSSGLASGGSGTGSSGTGAAGNGGMLIDAGYVFCATPQGADAGFSGWLCQPGTYLCDLDKPGTCFQCQNDGDCANPDLPTYDPNKFHCDLDSGVPGYQNFCQQCLEDFECTGNAAGAYCDTNPADLDGVIATVGFEACQANPSAACAPGSHSARGGCLPGCVDDQDCAGLISSAQVPAAHCVGSACSLCGDGGCPNACTGNSDCGGFWPICEFADGGGTFGGQPIGVCGCDSDAQCGFSGLQCLTPPRAFPGTPPGPYCAYSCTGPSLPACAALEVTVPICDTRTGFCAPCASDLDCQTQGAQPTVGRFCRNDGACGCKTNSDCSDGAACLGPSGTSHSGAALGSCVARGPHCTPGACRDEFCDWQSGVCTEPGKCLSDYDCSFSPSARGRFCSGSPGECVGCRDDLDCANLGLASQGLGHCLAGGLCGCGSDTDCTGNPSGSSCDSSPGDPLYGACSCRSASDCPLDQACPISDYGAVRCTTGCKMDADCAAGNFCDPAAVCRPRCDPGHSCDGTQLVCDSDDVAGQNGGASSGPVPGAVWCYACLHAGDCPQGLGCGADTGYSCGACGQSSDCGSGGACLGGACHAACEAGTCPRGELCDVGGLTDGGLATCVQCLSALDCPDGEGCDSVTHSCGTCRGPNWQGGPYDCPPGAVCSSYWSSSLEGVCLQNCDEFPCPVAKKCEVLPGLTPDHAYCFGCLQDSDCVDGGGWCDVSVNLTFTCQP